MWHYTVPYQGWLGWVKNKDITQNGLVTHIIEYDIVLDKLVPRLEDDG